MKTYFHRRDILLGGLATGLGSGVALLSGCVSRGRGTASLPSPDWPHTRPGEFNAPRPASAGTNRAAITPTGRVAIVPRQAWTRAQPKVWDTNPMSGIDRITVHHDGLEPVALNTDRETASRLEIIRRSHVDGNGWADIGYHFAIDPRGKVWAARPLERQGAHVRDENEHNMGVLMMGHFGRQAPTPAATASLDSLIAEAATVNRVRLDRIRTHQEWNPTECPGASLQKHMDQTRSGRGRLRSALA